MEAGRFKVFKYLNDWFDEFRLYHRKDGKVHKEGDDLMSATRYAVMMLRYARTAAEHDRFNRRIVYPNTMLHECKALKTKAARSAKVEHSRFSGW